jgi:hypothetical protein
MHRRFPARYHFEEIGIEKVPMPAGVVFACEGFRLSPLLYSNPPFQTATRGLNMRGRLMRREVR